jgi:hypothetical protein
MSEIMGTLFKYLMGLLGLAVVVGILYATLFKNKSSSEVANLTQLSTNISTTYTGQPTFTGLTTAIAANLAPASMVSGATLVNAWGGPITVAADAGNPSTFDVVEYAVPSNGCVDLVNKASNYVSLTLGGTTYSASNPLNPGAATTACNAAATSTISFVYGH